MKNSFTAKLVLFIAISMFCGLLTPVAFAASAAKFDTSPCQGMIQNLSDKNKADLGRAVTKQLNISYPRVNVKSVTVLRVFAVDNWSIVHVQPHVADEIFLFYSGNPLTSRYVTDWSGWADENDGPMLKDWISKDVSGLPPKLAGCFVWYLTEGR